MRPLQVVILLLLIALLSVGCSKTGDKDIGIVKNGYMNFNNTITVGKAFDGYKYFGKKEWIAEKTAQGLRTVTFKAQFNQQYIDNVNKEYKGKPGSIYAENGLASRTITIQYTINIIGTFAPTSTKSVITLTTGKTVENSVMQFEVDSIFKNEMI
jgi:hypothetical protein